MRGKPENIFTTIRTEGALLPAEILRRIVEGDRKLEGLDPESYHLEKTEKINEAVNRSWFRCLGAWRTFRAAAEKLPDADTGTTLTRERWLLILFQELGYGRLLVSKSQEIGGAAYPISHIWHHTPIHLVGFRQELDRRTPGVAGAARLSPHSLVQEFLNRSDNHLWGVVSNGHQLRIMRDNISLTRQAYVEFDLESLMEGEIYTDFVLLYLLLHQSRLEADKPENCWLELWSREAQERGTRALDRLRVGVEQAITDLGQGFLAHPENMELRLALQAGTLSPLGYYQQLLRLIYRFIFLFVAEDRGLIPLSDASPAVKKRYAFYAIARLRRLAGRRRGTRHGDLYAGLRVTFTCLEKGEPSLGISALNGFLFSPEALPDLNGCKLTNDALLSAIRGLSYTEENRLLRPVDYRNLGTEELGSVYESLLELHPELNAEAFTFALKTYAGSERKTTGSYYTHPSLIRCLLDSALELLLNEAMKKPAPEEALLSLKVVDPACGSGHFLIAAAHRIAKDLAVVRTGEGEPPLEALREAIRDVVANCIYGVDINPLAVELCKVALWLESLDPRKPLGFLDHRIKCGNSIIGSTPELLKEGIPDDAFKPIEGDDPAVATSIRRKNKEERKGQQDLFMIQEDHPDWREAASAYAAWASLPEDNIKQVAEKARQYDALLGDRAVRHQHELADLWTAAFFWPLTKETYDTVPTQDVFRRLRDGAYALAGKTAGRVKGLAEEHRFFHWHLEFPEVFMRRQGFDCVLGNPPWEMMEAKDGETASNEFAHQQKFFKSNDFKILSGRRDLYKLFLVACAKLLNSSGRLGFLTPFGVFIEDEASAWRASYFDRGSVLELRHFQNHKKRFFPSVHSSYRFCAVTFTPDPTYEHMFTSVALTPDDILSQHRVIIMRAEFDEWLGAERSATIYPDGHYSTLHQAVIRGLHRFEKIKFRVVAEFHSSTDKTLISKDSIESAWVLLKNRNIHHFNHRFALPEAWIRPEDVRDRDLRKGLNEPEWITRFPRLVFRDIARNDDERTLIACLAPPGSVSTYDTPMFVPECQHNNYPAWIAFFASAFSSFLFDFLVRPVVDKHIKGYTLARIRWPSPKHVNANQN